MAVPSRSALAVYEAVRLIPEGFCASYGSVGQTLNPPISGLLVGRLLSHSPPDVPWWRVVGRDGSLLIAKKGAEIAIDQEERLRAEGVQLFEGRVPCKKLLLEL